MPNPASRSLGSRLAGLTHAGSSPLVSASSREAAGRGAALPSSTRSSTRRALAERWRWSETSRGRAAMPKPAPSDWLGRRTRSTATTEARASKSSCIDLRGNTQACRAAYRRINAKAERLVGGQTTPANVNTTQPPREVKAGRGDHGPPRQPSVRGMRRRDRKAVAVRPQGHPAAYRRPQRRGVHAGTGNRGRCPGSLLPPRRVRRMSRSHRRRQRPPRALGLPGHAEDALWIVKQTQAICALTPQGF